MKMGQADRTACPRIQKLRANFDFGENDNQGI